MRFEAARPRLWPCSSRTCSWPGSSIRSRSGACGPCSRHANRPRKHGCSRACRPCARALSRAGKAALRSRVAASGHRARPWLAT
eukprot:13010286-Alexandrium_andersonii.AAC.1